MKTLRYLVYVLTICTLAFAVPGENLVAEWDFSVKTDSAKDGSYAGGVLRGETKIVDGWLTPAPGFADKPEGYCVHPKQIFKELTPAGGFRMEVVARVNAEVTDCSTYMMFDNKYLLGVGDTRKDADTGYAFALIRNGPNTPNTFYMQCFMGFQDHSIAVRSKSFTLVPGETHTFTFEFNGGGRILFLLDGVVQGTAFFKGNSVAPAVRTAIIGDRFSSTHNRFNGQIKSLKLFSFPPQTLMLLSYGRVAFLRTEKNAFLEYKLKNCGESPLRDIVINCQFAGDAEKPAMDKYQPTGKEIGTLEPGASHIVSIPFDTSRMIGTYPISVTATGKNEKGMVSDSIKMETSICPLNPPDTYPILMWGSDKIENMKRTGFTHNLGGYGRDVLYTQDLESTITRINSELDNYLINDFRHADYFTLAHDKKLIEQFPRFKKDGTPVVKNIEASNPEYQKIISDVAAKTADIISNHPACDALLINSEVRDSTMPSFGKFEPKEFEKFAGYPIPKEVVSKGGVNYDKIPGFPFSRIVPDDNPILTYYRWFWKNGDGWNVVHSKVSEQYHKHIHRPFWSFFDPAVRVPPVWGSGGTVDYLSHWTYAYPDPIRPAATTDELFAMAEGTPGQKVMTMTQIICYRSATAPIGKHPENEPDWVKDSPEGPFITIPPDSASIALWSMISRDVKGIMYHGSGSLWGKPGNKGYVTTNEQTKERMAELHKSIVWPLGPTLKRIPERKPEVAILHSFASSVFAGRGTWGWSSWLYDAHLMLQWANLSPSVIYEEKIQRDGLGGIKVLCMFHCDVLSEAAYKKIIEFQNNGGIIIADEFLTPAIMPDLLITSVNRPPQADKGKAELQAVASTIRSKLKGCYEPYSDASNQDIITRVRTYKNADYLFLINDKRTFGDYLGPWKLTMEKGLPNSGSVTLKRKNVKGVYDLVQHEEIPFSLAQSNLTLQQSFAPAEGRLLLVLDQKIGSVKCKVTQGGKAPAQVTLAIDILNDAFFAKPVQALIPIDITFTSPSGKVLDGSGAACAVDGHFDYTLETTPEPGLWTVKVTELASGKTSTQNFTLK
ncbi:MAG: hypothetical protein IKP00_05270 [Victivallales bacterium]|nr:hypothetical protein [Victivallales bacterium]